MSSYTFSSIIVFLLVKLSAADNFEVDGGANSVYYKEAERFLQSMDESVNPCNDFYNFTCGRYMKKASNLDSVSPSYDHYMKLMNDIQNILESEQDIPDFDVSVARNIYKNCKNIVPDSLKERQLIDVIASNIGLIKGIYETNYGKIYYDWNDQFDWVDGVQKLRQMGLNFRFLVGFYVSPRSHSDKRNILEIREPFLMSDHTNPSKAQENLTIVNAGEYINSLNGSFPLQKLIEGFLPNNANFSLEDDIRVDKFYINELTKSLQNISAPFLAIKLYAKLEHEIVRLLPSIYNLNRKETCVENAIYYDYSFQAAASKTFFTEKKKDFITDLTSNILNITKMLINRSASFDETSRIRTIRKLSNLQLMIGYGNNIIEPPSLDWNDVDYFKYVNNILSLSKYQMDAKFQQLNFVKDVREWEMNMIPSTYNAAYFLLSNTLYTPALYLSSKMHRLNSPNYIHYGSVGFTIAHELGHAIDFSTNCDRLFEDSKKYNFAGSTARENKLCLRQAFNNITGTDKMTEKDDFADLAGYKIAYYSFLDSENKNGADRSLPGMNYNSRQMFWITSANAWCSKDAFKFRDDYVHSPHYVRVMLPLSNLPEFARDFNCPIGSPMNPETKCKFL